MCDRPQGTSAGGIPARYLGAYALFQMTLPDTLKTTDLLPALEWATQLIAQSDHMGGFRGKSLADGGETPE
jgi:hypothetical protein